jgi:sugar/nucleoside kinase (ribokinase family)
MIDDRLHDVVGIGNAILDVIAETDERFLESQGLVKGSMALIDADQARALYADMGPAVECSGGSAANTMVGIASLGGRAAYVGKVHNDPLGTAFGADLLKAGVQFATPMAPSGPETGRCLVLVTPDAQRTMQTFLGAAATLAPEDVDPAVIEGSQITYLEGYLFDPPPAREAFFNAARIAHAAGRKVALSLSDSFCVDRHRAELLEFVTDQVDILFANEDEIISLYQAASFDDAAGNLRQHCELAALTRGAQGALVMTPEQHISIAAEPIEQLVDTTGAGDLYAAGFLFGLTGSQEPAVCGRLGAIAAAEVISHVGARPSVQLATLADKVLH